MMKCIQTEAGVGGWGGCCMEIGSQTIIVVLYIYNNTLIIMKFNYKKINKLTFILGLDFLT